MGFLKKAEWREAVSEAEFADQDRKMVDFGGEKQVALFKVEDRYHAISVWCSHQKTSMLHGELNGHELMCPLHGARFDVRSGKNLSLPAVRPVPTYPVKVEDGTIYIQA